MLIFRDRINLLSKDEENRALKYLVILIVLAMLLVPVMALAQPDITISPATGKPGDTVTIPVQFTNNGSVVGLQFDLQYNSAALNPGSLTAGSNLSPHTLSSSSPSIGVIRLLIIPPVTKPTPAVNDGVIVSIPFTISSGASAGPYSVSLLNVVLSDASAFSVNPGALTNGNISVENTYTVTPSAGANGGISPAVPQTVNQGQTTSFSVTPGTSYHIVSVTGCGGGLSGNTYTTGAITTNCTVAATFAIDTHTLTLAKTGTGSGTVASSPAGISCGTACSGTYNAGTTVTFTVTPLSGSTFAGWSGDADCSDGIVTMTAIKTCMARFNLAPQELALSVSVSGKGTVTSSPSGVSCPDDCSESYPSGAVLNLLATPDRDHTFSGWGGDCASAGTAMTCTVTMDAGKSVSATFIPTRGLKGEYYDHPDLSALSLARIDPVVDFNWGTGSPDPSMDVDAFSTRWTGNIQVDYDETYTFYVVTDDGVRLWIDGYLLMNYWQAGGVSASGTMSLTAGLHDIKIEFFENSGDALVHLYWSSPSTPYALVPQDHLYPPPSEGEAPILAWTGETNYIADGIDPQNGDTNIPFIYRIKYTDADGDAPMNGYPRVHILKGGQEISGSPFAMSFAEGSYPGGAIYTYSTTLLEGTDYTVYFDAEDATGLQAVATPIAPTPTAPINAPDVNAPALSGDMDSSGRVDGFDLGRLGLSFGSRPGDPNWNSDADLNGDGIVDSADLAILVENFGKTK